MFSLSLFAPWNQTARKALRGGSKRPRRLQFEPLEQRLALATLPTGFVETAAATGLGAATAMEFSPDGKLFITEAPGTMEVWQGGTRLRPNFFANTPLTPYDAGTDTGIVDDTGERGLLGVTFDPNYASNRYVYVYYTFAANADGNTSTPTTFHNRVSRFTANTAGDLALAGSELPIVDLDNLSFLNHNGGAIHFGPDDKLYIATGDNANGANSQSLSNRLGKILRVNSDGSIPTDNPFFGTATGANRAIWALGLRNPFTFAFQPGSGQMFINDVGQVTWEEINQGAAGANYGWPSTEGDFNQSSFPNFTRPVYAYSHGSGTFQGFAITGGAFYNPTSPTTGAFPATYTGDYFFADFVNNWINVIDLGTNTVERFATGALGAVDLKLANDGSLYYLARNEGRVVRVTSTLPVAGTLDISGTANADQVTVNFSSATNFAVTLNGTTTNYTTAQFSQINFDGLAGLDTVTVVTPSGADAATLTTSGATITGANYSLALANTEVKYFFGDLLDSATFSDSSGADQLYQLPDYSVMLDGTASYYNQVIGFGSSSATATSGVDLVLVYGTGGNDTYTASTTASSLTGGGYTLAANNFDQVYTFGGGGVDAVTFTGSTGNDVYYGLDGYSVVVSSSFLQYMVGFATVVANANGGAADGAIFFDGAGNDVLNGDPTTASFIGTTFNNRANGFDQVFVFSTSGLDTANLAGSALADIFSGSSTNAAMFRPSLYLLQVYGFAQVNANLLGGGIDIAELIDGGGNDTFNSSGNTAEIIYSTGNRVRVMAQSGSGALDYVYAKSVNGGVNTRNVINPLAYELAFQGTWI